MSIILYINNINIKIYMLQCNPTWKLKPKGHLVFLRVTMHLSTVSDSQRYNDLRALGYFIINNLHSKGFQMILSRKTLISWRHMLRSVVAGTTVETLEKVYLRIRGHLRLKSSHADLDSKKKVFKKQKQTNLSSKHLKINNITNYDTQHFVRITAAQCAASVL